MFSGSGMRSIISFVLVNNFLNSVNFQGIVDTQILWQGGHALHENGLEEQNSNSGDLVHCLGSEEVSIWSGHE